MPDLADKLIFTSKSSKVDRHLTFTPEYFSPARILRRELEGIRCGTAVDNISMDPIVSGLNPDGCVD